MEARAAIQMPQNRVRLNTALYYVQFAFTSICTLVITPILIGALGAAGFGALKLCQKVVDLVAFADGRGAQTLKTTLALQLGKHAGETQLKQQIGAALFVSVKFSPWLISLSLAAGYGIFYFSESDPQRLSVAAIFSILIPLCIAVLLQPLSQVPEAALTAGGWSYRSSLIQMVVTLSGTIAYALISLNGLSIAHAASVSVLTTVLGSLLMTLMAKRTYSWYALEVPAKDQKTTFLGAAKKLLFWSAAEKFLLAIDSLLVGVFCGTAALTKFTLSSYTYQLSVVVCLLATSALNPLIVQALGRSNRIAVDGLVARARGRVIVLSATAACVILLTNKVFVSSWADLDQHAGIEVDLMLAVALLQIAIIRADGQFLDAYQAWTAKAFAFTASSTVAAICLWLLSSSVDLQIKHVMVVLVITRFPLLWAMRSFVAQRLEQPIFKRSKWPALVTSLGLASALVVAIPV